MTDGRPMTADEVRAVVRSACLMVLEDQSATVSRNDCVLRGGTKERRQALEFCSDVIADHVAEKLAGRVVAAQPERKEFDAESCDSGDDCESSDYVDGWNDALDSIRKGTLKQAAERVEVNCAMRERERDAARLALDRVASELRAREARAMSLEQLAAVAAADARYDVTGSEEARRVVLNAVPSLIGAVRDLHDLQAKLAAILNEDPR